MNRKYERKQVKNHADIRTVESNTSLTLIHTVQVIQTSIPLTHGRQALRKECVSVIMVCMAWSGSDKEKRCTQKK